MPMHANAIKKAKKYPRILPHYNRSEDVTRWDSIQPKKSGNFICKLINLLRELHINPLTTGAALKCGIQKKSRPPPNFKYFDLSSQMELNNFWGMSTQNFPKI